MSQLKVPYAALQEQLKTIKSEVMDEISHVLDRGIFILGDKLKQFEKEFAVFCGVRHSLGIDNGTSALHLVWKMVGLQPGDEVITVPNSFLATASSAALLGAKPVFVDILPNLNIDPSKIEAAITSKTRGIVPVHLTGRPADMKPIMEIAERRGLFVLEDSAQAVGAKYHGQRVGGLGHAGAFSLHPLKNLFAIGDGGMVTCNDEKLIKKIAQARNHGLHNREQCDYWSFNNRLDELQAAILLVTLKKLDEWTETRRKLAFQYNEALKDIVKVPTEGPGEYCVYQTFAIQAEDRDKLQKHLVEAGITALVHYKTPIHLQPAAKYLGYGPNDFPVCRHACERILSLPLFPTMTAQQQEHVITQIRAFYGKK